MPWEISLLIFFYFFNKFTIKIDLFISPCLLFLFIFDQQQIFQNETIHVCFDQTAANFLFFFQTIIN